MSIGTVVLLPPAQLSGDLDESWPNRQEIADELVSVGVNVLALPEATDIEPGLDLRNRIAHWVAHNAIALVQARPPQPIMLVATGIAGSLLPAMGFSQRASQSPVAGYVVIDGALPKAGVADWPDAPVTYIATAAMSDPAAADASSILRQAQLRGWNVESTNNPAPILHKLATA